MKLCTILVIFLLKMTLLKTWPHCEYLLRFLIGSQQGWRSIVLAHIVIKTSILYWCTMESSLNFVLEHYGNVSTTRCIGAQRKWPRPYMTKWNARSWGPLWLLIVPRCPTMDFQSPKCSIHGISSLCSIAGPWWSIWEFYDWYKVVYTMSRLCYNILILY